MNARFVFELMEDVALVIGTVLVGAAIGLGAAMIVIFNFFL